MYHSYLELYNHFKNFFLQYGLAKENDFIGLNECECNKLEDELETILDKSIKEYLKLFGSGIKCNLFSGQQFTLKSIDRGSTSLMKWKNEHNIDIIEKIESTTSLDNIICDKLESPLKSILVLDYNEIGGCYTVIQKEKIDPYIYWHFGEYSKQGILLSNNIRFSEYVRVLFSSAVLQYCKEHSWNHSDPIVKKLLKLDWIQFSKEFEKKLNNKTKRLRTLFRHDVKREIKDMNPKPDLNYGEQEFINYIIENRLI